MCFITYKSLKTVLIQVVLSLMILLFLNALEKNNTSSASCSEWTGEALILRTTRILYISSLFQLRWFLEVASLFCLLLNLRKAKHQCIMLCHSYMVCAHACYSASTVIKIQVFMLQNFQMHHILLVCQDDSYLKGMRHLIVQFLNLFLCLMQRILFSNTNVFFLGCVPTSLQLASNGKL